MRFKLLAAVTLFIFSLPIFLLGQDKAFVSYKVDGKEFYFTEGILEYHPDEGWGSLKGLKIEKLDLGEYHFPRYGEIEIGIWVDISPDENTLVGKHQAKLSDEMPVSITWYEWIDKEKGEFKEFYIHQDETGESDSIFTLEIENFGPPGSIITGTFSGKLVDDEGIVYQITEGKFAVTRTDVD